MQEPVAVTNVINKPRRPVQQLIIKAPKNARHCRYCGGEMTDRVDITHGYHDECLTRHIIRKRGYQTSLNRPRQATFKDYKTKKKNSPFFYL
jgi:hypothetical protein